MSPVQIGAVAVGVIAAIDLFIVWLAGGFRHDEPDPPLLVPAEWEQRQPWDAGSVESTLAEIERL